MDAATCGRWQRRRDPLPESAGRRDRRRWRRRRQRRLPPRRGGRRRSSLLERDQLGSGSTSKAAGGFRTQFSRPAQHRDRAPAAPRRSRRSSTPPGLGDRPARGRLPVPASPARRTSTRSPAASRCRTSSACPPAWSRPSEARELAPLLEVDDVIAASYSPAGRPRHAGGGRPGLRVRRAPARRAPADRLRGRPDRARDGRIEAVHAERRRPVQTDTVICAAGAWSAALRGARRRRPAGDAAAPPGALHRADGRTCRERCR